MNRTFKYIKYKIKKFTIDIFQIIYQQTVGKILIKHNLETIQNSYILDIYKYPRRFDYRKLIRYKINKAILEIGTGNGENLCNICKQNTNAIVIGIELVKEFFFKTSNNLSRSNCVNGKIIYGEALEVISKYFKNNFFDEIHIICPDPWPKKKHIKHRLVFNKNFNIIYNKLKQNGTIILITDNETYSNTFLETLKKLEIKYYVEFYNKLPRYIFRTKYIRKWEKQNKGFWLYKIVK